MIHPRITYLAPQFSRFSMAALHIAKQLQHAEVCPIETPRGPTDAIKSSAVFFDGCEGRAGMLWLLRAPADRESRAVFIRDHNLTVPAWALEAKYLIGIRVTRSRQIPRGSIFDGFAKEVKTLHQELLARENEEEYNRLHGTGSPVMDGLPI